MLVQQLNVIGKRAWALMQSRRARKSNQSETRVEVNFRPEGSCQSLLLYLLATDPKAEYMKSRIWRNNLAHNLAVGFPNFRRCLGQYSRGVPRDRSP
jgi:hypothetical protein